MIDTGILLCSGASNPLDIGQPLNDELVGEDDTKYGQVSPTAGKEEGWATTLSNPGLE